MKHSLPMKVSGSMQIPANRMNIHPNEGFDLGLMTTKYTLEMDDLGSVEVFLLNECPKETLQLNYKTWEKLGKPGKVIMELEEGKLSLKLT